jgi:hypothetical protein
MRPSRHRPGETLEHVHGREAAFRLVVVARREVDIEGAAGGVAERVARKGAARDLELVQAAFVLR